MAKASTRATPRAVDAEDPRIVALVDRAVATHDRAAFGQLFDRFARQIYCYLYGRCGQHADAEDLTAQVFLKAWEAIGRYRWQGRPFVAWLYRLARNAHIDHVRRQRRAVSLDDTAKCPELEVATARGDLAADVDVDDLLATAVRRLTPKQQQLIHLRFTADLDTGEIAAIMGEQESAIRSLQMRALISLRRVLDQLEQQAGPDGVA